MHANELLKRIVLRIVHHTESERDELLAAVDQAFPIAEPEPDEGQAVDEDQAHEPDTGTPGVTTAVFSDTAATGAAGA